MVGLVEFDGYYAGDIASYESQTGVPNVPLQIVLLDGFNGVPEGANSDNSEVALDIEMAISMAPGLSKVVVFEAGPVNGLPNDVLQAMSLHQHAHQTIQLFLGFWLRSRRRSEARWTAIS